MALRPLIDLAEPEKGDHGSQGYGVLRQPSEQLPVTVSTTVGNSLLGSPLIEIDTTALIGSRHFPSVARRRQISSTSPLRAILLPV